MVRDYYAILGVVPGERDDTIREAYRTLAKAHHPDRAGRASTDRFREIIEAYETLSDPRRRAAYDRERRRGSDGRHEPVRRRHRTAAVVEPEPLRPWGGPPPKASTSRAPPEVAERRDHVLELEILLSPEEAALGPVAPIEVPVTSACPGCGGRGVIGRFVCPTCHGAGIVTLRATVQVRIPPGVTDGTVIELSSPGERTLPSLIRLHIRRLSR